MIKSKIEIVLANIESLSKSERKSLMARCLKAAEELGELSEAVLATSDASGMAYKNLTVGDVKEEAADVLQVVFSICYMLGMSTDEIASLLDKKAKKWKLYQEKS